MEGNQFQKSSKATILSMIDAIKYEDFKKSLGYFSCQSQNVLYDCSWILCSLFDLLIESHCEINNKPVIVYHRASGLPDTFTNMSKPYNDRNVIYIAPNNNMNNFVIFYFLNKQKKVLLIDPLYTKRSIDFFKNPISSFLQKEGYSLYISNTEIQQDNYSCGPLISEITRMLYYNYRMFEDFSSKNKTSKCTEEGLEYSLIDIKHFLPKHGFDYLLSSFKTLGTVNYGTVEKELSGADFRIAHLIIVSTIGFGDIEYYALPKLPVTIGSGNIEYYALPELPVEGREKYQHAKEIVENVRSIFIGNLDNVNLFNQEIGKWYQKFQSYKTTGKLANSTGLFEESDTQEETKSEQSNADSSTEQEHLELIKKYLEDGEDINAIDREGKSLLQYATDNSYFEMAVFLLNNRANVNILNHHQKKSLLNHIIENQITIDLETANSLGQKHSEYNKGSSKSNDSDSSQLCSKDKRNFELVIYSTQRDGNCFFHATFGDSSSRKCKSEKVVRMRREWHNFLNQFTSLKDTSMPISLKEQLKKVFCFFLDNTKNLTNKSSAIRVLADKVNQDIENATHEISKLAEDIIEKFINDEGFRKGIYQIISKTKYEEGKELPDIQTLLNETCVLKDAILNNLEDCALKLYPSFTKEQYHKHYNLEVIADLFLESTNLYNSYLQAIKSSSYYVFFEEVPILASLANIRITIYYHDKGRCRSVIFEPNFQLLGGYVSDYELWSGKKEAVMYYEFEHFSQASIECFLRNSKIQNIFSENTPRPWLQSGSTISSISNSSSAIKKFLIDSQTSSQQLQSIDLKSTSSSELRTTSSDTILKIVIDPQTSSEQLQSIDLKSTSSSELRTTSSDTKIVIDPQTSSQQLQCVSKEKRIGEQSYLRLHNAVESDDIDKVRQLIANGYSVNKKDKDGITSLHLAANNGYKDIAKLLIEKGARVNKTNNANIAPIHLAASNGHVNIVNVLIKNGADVNIQDEDGKTPLCFAIEYGHTEVVVILKKNGAGIKVDSDKKLIFFHSVNNNTTSLHYAVKSGDIDKVRQLIANGYSVNKKDKDGRSPRYIAIENGHMSIFELLVNNGDDANVTDNVHNALRRIPLHNAAEYGDIDKVNELITNGVNVNIEDKARTTPLHLAARNGHNQIVRLLIMKEADVNAQNLFGIAPLHLATENAHQYIVDLLIYEGAKVNIKNNTKTTPLHLAAGSGDEDIVNLLIDSRAKVNVTNNANTTPLHLAAGNGHVNVVSILIKNEADINRKDKDGRMALYLAKKNCHVDVIELLIESHCNEEKPSSRVQNSHSLSCKVGETSCKRV